MTARDHPDPAGFRYSVVIPVYNSERIVGETVDRVVGTFAEAGLDLELILVNDGSPDRSWEVISERARRFDNVTAIRLLRNYGQHHANMVGLRESSGDFVITMDDDLQNPPDQALVLIDRALEGYDVVFGKFEQKAAAGHRRIGTRLIGLINRRVFDKPDDLVVSNFRILRRDVVDRICASRANHPYLTGQALMFSSERANALVRHDPRKVGHSNYNLRRILKLVFTILFSYSSFPLRFAAGLGFVMAGVSLLLGCFFLIRGLVMEQTVPGWTTLVVLLSVFNGFMFAMLSMLGEYVVRTLNAVSVEEPYHVMERVRR